MGVIFLEINVDCNHLTYRNNYLPVPYSYESDFKNSYEENGEIFIFLPIVSQLEIKSNLSFSRETDFLVITKSKFPRLVKNREMCKFEWGKKYVSIFEDYLKMEEMASNLFVLTDIAFQATSTIGGKQDYCLTLYANEILVKRKSVFSKPASFFQGERIFRFSSSNTKNLKVEEKTSKGWSVITEFRLIIKVFRLLTSSYRTINKAYGEKPSSQDAIVRCMFIFILVCLNGLYEDFGVDGLLAYRYFCQTKYTKYKELCVPKSKIDSLYFADLANCNYEFKYYDNDWISRLIELRQQVDYYLSIGDTKSARNLFLMGYNFAPSVQKMVIGAPVVMSPELLGRLDRFITASNSSSLLLIWRLCQEYSDSPSNSNAMEQYLTLHPIIDNLMNVIKLTELGFSIKHINNLFEKRTSYKEKKELFVYFEDCLTMTERLVENMPEYIVSHKNIVLWHDFLVRQLNEYDGLQALSYLGDTDYVREKLSEPYESISFQAREILGYVFKPIDRIIDLFDVGLRLNNCVGSAGYVEKLYQRLIDIILVYKDDCLLACLEVSKRQGIALKQAKLNYNKPVKSSIAVNQAVVQWMKDQAVDCDTSDVLLSCNNRAV